MKGLMVMLITGVMAVGAAGCAAASAYKFTCDKGVCNVETSGPATLDLEQEFGETLEVVETGGQPHDDGRRLGAQDVQDGRDGRSSGR